MFPQINKMNLQKLAPEDQMGPIKVHKAEMRDMTTVGAMMLGIDMVKEKKKKVDKNLLDAFVEVRTCKKICKFHIYRGKQMKNKPS